MEQLTRIIRLLGPAAVGFTVFVFGLTAPFEDPVDTIAGSGNSAFRTLLVMGVASAVSGLAAAFARRTLWPVLIAAAVGWAFFTMYATIVAASYYAAIHLTRRRSALAYLGLATVAIVTPIAIGMDVSTTDDLAGGLVVGSVGAMVLVGLPFSIGLYTRARRQVVDGLRERAERLEREQSARADRARAEERTRIAREMHDVVAHRVALMVLHAGALEVNTADERLANEAALIRTTGREALHDLRQVLGVLRGGASETDLVPQPDLSDVERLLDRTRAAGLPVSYVQEGAPGALPAVVQRTAYRVIQEALTNVVKHNGSVDTVVLLRYQPHTVDVRVDNAPPPGPVERLPGSGLGLIGLRERVALLYGRFEARQRLDGGFTVHAVLPASLAEVPA